MSTPRATLRALVLALTSAATASSCAVTPRYPDEAMRMAALVGGRLLDDAGPLDEQPLVGLEVDWLTSDPAWRYELGLSYSVEDDTGGDASLGSTDAELSLWEAYAGARWWIFGKRRLRPYVGGGFSFAVAELDVSDVGTPSDASIGGYLHGGITYDLTRHVFVGIDVRARLGQDFQLDAQEVDGFYQQAAVVLGFVP